MPPIRTEREAKAEWTKREAFFEVVNSTRWRTGPGRKLPVVNVEFGLLVRKMALI